MSNLMRLKQHDDETVANLIKIFFRLRSRCNVKLLEADHAIIAIGNMHPLLRKRLIALEYTNLNQLITKASRMERFIMKKE